MAYKSYSDGRIDLKYQYRQASSEEERKRLLRQRREDVITKTRSAFYETGKGKQDRYDYSGLLSTGANLGYKETVTEERFNTRTRYDRYSRGHVIDPGELPLDYKLQIGPTDKDHYQRLNRLETDTRLLYANSFFSAG